MNKQNINQGPLVITPVVDHVNNNNGSQLIRNINESPPQNPPLLVVKATHEYVPVNNDELHISPGDIITISNPEEGGWWEGTLGSKTGWFPSNYVVVIDNNNEVNNLNSIILLPQQRQSGALLSNSVLTDQVTEYKRLITQEIIETERVFIQELEDFYDKICSINTAQHDPVINKLKSNLNGLITTHKTHVFGILRSEVNDNPTNYRVGRVFLNAAKFLESSHVEYCSNHPRFIKFVEGNQEAFESVFGGDVGSVLRVVVGLSAPFRRVEKYGGFLNELDSHSEVFCGDKGDLRRGVEYFRGLEKTLTSTRKQKEMELEVLTPGAIKELEGPDICNLGDILLMDLMFVTGRGDNNNKQQQPRYFILFSSTVLILYYDNSDSTFTYKGKVLVSGVTVIHPVDFDGEEFGFEIAGPTLHQITVQCQGKEIRNKWVSKLSELTLSTPRCYNNSSSSTNSVNNHHQSHPQTPAPSSSPLKPGTSNWNITRLRVSPPYNPFLAEYQNGSVVSGIKKRGSGGSRGGSSSGGSFVGIRTSSSGVSNEDDFAVLSIVDGFCVRGGVGVSLRNDTNNRSIRSLDYNVNNVIRSTAHQPVPVHRYTTSVSSSPSSSSNFNKPLHTIVKTLHEDVALLHERISLLSKQIEDERVCRGQLFSILRGQQQQQGQGQQKGS